LSTTAATTAKAGFPRVQLIANDENRGSAADNQGIAAAEGGCILLLNPDTIVHAGALETMIRSMDDHEGIGIWGPLLLNCDGTTRPLGRQFPSFRCALYRNAAFRNIGLFRTHYHRYTMCDFTYDRSCDVDQVMGAHLLPDPSSGTLRPAVPGDSRLGAGCRHVTPVVRPTE
jgi:GT2 family glycosyltransferase